MSAINAHVGSRIRLLRRSVDITSKYPSYFIGVTYQQVLAYEAGQNKVSAGNLYLIAEALNVPVSFFFDDMPDDLIMSNAELSLSNDNEEEALNIFSILDIKVIEAEIRLLADVYYLIDDPAIRKGAVNFMKIVGKKF